MAWKLRAVAIWVARSRPFASASRGDLTFALEA
jgi:hypothetical protein